MNKKVRGGIQHGKQSVVRFKYTGSRKPLPPSLRPKDVTVQQLLSKEYAADWLHDQLTGLILPDLKKAAKMGQKVSLESIVKDLQRELREYRKILADDSVGSDYQVTVIPEDETE